MFLIEAAPLTSIPRPNPQILTYFTGKKLSVGCLILVPLFKRQVPALVLRLKKVSQEKSQIKQADFLTRSIVGVVNSQPILPPVQIQLALWISQYYWAPLGKVLKSMLPLTRYLDSQQKPNKHTLKQIPSPTYSSPSLRKEEEKRREKQVGLIYQQNCQTPLNEYLDPIKSAMHNQQSTIILVPEIRQIKFWQKTLEEKLDQQTAVLYSRLTPKKYFLNWLKIRQNKAKIIIGTRLAVLAPVLNLGSIIVTQEHSPFYKSFDQKPYLQARDTALKLAQLTGAKIILSSATPSLEIYWQKQKTTPSDSPLLRERTNTLPPFNKGGLGEVKIKIIDLRQEIKAGNFSMLSRELQNRLKTTLQQKKQALLFINRKGAASAILCRDCGRTINCPRCSVPLIYHTVLRHSEAAPFCHSEPPIHSGTKNLLRRAYQQAETRPREVNTGNNQRSFGQSPHDDNLLLCHHCGWQQTVPQECPYCHSYRLKSVGGGTQKLMTQVSQLLSQARLAIFDKDHMARPQDEKIILKNWLAKKIDILTATSLIFNLEPKFKADFIGVVNIDRSLNLPDFRSNERTWQLLKRLECLLANQLANTPSDSPLAKGRTDAFPFLNKRGVNFLIQTYSPKNYVIQAISQNNDQIFYQKEIKARLRLFYPPFSHLIKLTFKHRSFSESQEQTQILKAKLTYATQKVKDKIKILGPAPGFIPKIKNQYVWQIVLKVHHRLMPKLPTLLGIILKQWSIDIDPESLL